MAIVGARVYDSKTGKYGNIIDKSILTVLVRWENGSQSWISKRRLVYV